MFTDLVPAGFRQNQEFTIPIEKWQSLTKEDKSQFLGLNRLFLIRYSFSFKQIVTEVTFCKHTDSTLIKI